MIIQGHERVASARPRDATIFPHRAGLTWWNNDGRQAMPYISYLLDRNAMPKPFK
jgi:hypothetical protein